jgi:hypothetical protein
MININGHPFSSSTLQSGDFPFSRVLLTVLDTPKPHNIETRNLISVRTHACLGMRSCDARVGLPLDARDLSAVQNFLH